MAKEMHYKGEWIAVETEAFPNAKFRCSCCEKDVVFESGQNDWYWGDPPPFLYCPYCGDDKRDQRYRLAQKNVREYLDRLGLD